MAARVNPLDALSSGKQGHTETGAPAVARGVSRNQQQLPKRLSISMERDLHRPFEAWTHAHKAALSSENLSMTRTVNALVSLMVEDPDLQRRVLDFLEEEDRAADALKN